METLGKIFERLLLILLFISPVLFLSLFAREYRLREARELTNDYLDEVLSYGVSLENYNAYEEALKTLKFTSSLTIYGKNAGHYTEGDLYECLKPAEVVENSSLHLSSGDNTYTLLRYSDYKTKGLDCICYVTVESPIPITISANREYENVTDQTIYTTNPNLIFKTDTPTTISVKVTYEPRITPSYLDFYSVGIYDASDDALMLVGRTMYSNIKY